MISGQGWFSPLPAIWLSHFDCSQSPQLTSRFLRCCSSTFFFHSGTFAHRASSSRRMRSASSFSRCSLSRFCSATACKVRQSTSMTATVTRTSFQLTVDEVSMKERFGGSCRFVSGEVTTGPSMTRSSVSRAFASCTSMRPVLCIILKHNEQPTT